MKAQYEIGMIGLGVMGRNLLLNMADHGHSVAGYDKDAAKVAAFRKETPNQEISGAKNLPEFLDLLRVPRAVMLLVPAGAPVDAVIHDLLPYLERGDLIIAASIVGVGTWRSIASCEAPIPVPSLGYLDAYRSVWMPANLIQAQRDYFGSHTYERVDARGVFHTQWQET